MSGRGHSGWLTVPLADPGLDVVRDWVEEGYRNVAPNQLVAGLERR